MKEFIDSLNLPFEGEMRNNQYIINLNSSNEFSTIFNLISLNNSLNSIDGSVATEDKTEFRYTNGEYEILLSANYVDDIYSILIEVR